VITLGPPGDPIALVAVVAAFFVGFTLLGLAISFALERLWVRPIWSLPTAPGQVALELRGNITFVVVAVVVHSLVLYFGLARIGDETNVRFIGTFVAHWFGFQIYYYWLHRAMHTKALVRFHRHHHESRVTSGLSGQSVSFVEALGWMVGYAGLPVAMSFVVPISFNGWLAYLAFNIVGNIVGHAKVELVRPNAMLWFSSTAAAVLTFHALHHARWTGHFGFGSSWADRLFRTEWRDWPALHRQIWAGEPLDNLKQRGELRP
jgi:sterol desaturase/sphingolipid hydroxylase (fatty acid hydroxylase superfamily)